MFVFVGVSGLVAAGATVVGAIFLWLFFSRGEPWGTLNDLASIVLMLATIPVALFLADVQDDAPPGSLGLEGAVSLAWLAAGVGVVGMIGATVAQALLVLRVRTYESLLPWTLGAGAIVGLWYALVGLMALAGRAPTLLAANRFPPILALLALAAGVGYVALGYGFWRGAQRHVASIVGGVLVLVASSGFLAWIGLAGISDFGLLMAQASVP